jgi:hypothetical protein
MYSTVPRCGLRLLALIAFYYRTRIDGVCLSSPGSIGYRQVLIRCSVQYSSIPYLSVLPYRPIPIIRWPMVVHGLGTPALPSLLQWYFKPALAAWRCIGKS